MGEEIPIAKNIRVVDEAGNEYEATYPKRAKGLVKNGRARFIDEETICLACPPNKNLEDKIMPNTFTNAETAQNINDKINKALAENPDADAGEIIREAAGLTLGFAQSAPQENFPNPGFTVEGILHRIDLIQKEKSHLTEAVEALAAMPQSSPGDIAGQGKAEALGKVVAAREETNRKMLSLLEKMYDDLRPVRPVYSDNDLAKDKLRIVMDSISDSDIDENSRAELFSKMINMYFNDR